MKKRFNPFLLAFLGVFSSLSAQWSDANFKSSRETILPPGAFEAGNDGGRPYYIAKVVFNGAIYITKMAKGSTSVSVPHGNTVANIGMIGAANNPFPVYCGDVQWASAGNGTAPTNSVVEALPGGNVYIARVNLGPSITTVGYVSVGQSEALYLDKGKLFKSSNYQLLTSNSTPPPVAVNPEHTASFPSATRRTADNRPASGSPVASENMKMGNVTLAFVYERGRLVSGEDTFVEATVYSSATRSVVGVYRLTSPKGELPIPSLPPGAYYATIKASYEVNSSGNREGWTTPIQLSYSPNPFDFSIRGGMSTIERVTLLRK